jgi:hypothetical protein
MNFKTIKAITGKLIAFGPPALCCMFLYFYLEPSTHAQSNAKPNQATAKPNPGPSVRLYEKRREIRDKYNKKNKPVETTNGPKLKVIYLWFTPTGFTTKDISIPAGPFILSINNHSGIKNIKFRLEHEDGQPIQDMVPFNKSSTWRNKVNLKPGLYRISAINHTSWNCNLTVN